MTSSTPAQIADNMVQLKGGLGPALETAERMAKSCVTAKYQRQFADVADVIRYRIVAAANPSFASERTADTVVTFTTESSARTAVAMLGLHADMPADHYADIEIDDAGRVLVCIRYKGGLRGACAGWAVGYLAVAR